MTTMILMHDDKDLQNFVKTSLEGLPFRILPSCTTTKEVYDQYQKEQAQIFLLDYFIPGSSGVEMLKPIRKLNESVIIILLARTRSRSLVEKAFRLGATDIMPYPTTSEVFRDTILHRLKNIKEDEIRFQKAEQEAKG